MMLVNKNGDWTEEARSAAKKVIRKHYGEAFILPDPSEFPGSVKYASKMNHTSRAAATKWLLNKIAIVYAFCILIESTNRKKTYYSRLRGSHNIKRTDGDVLALIMRSVHPRSVSQPNGMKRVVAQVSEQAKAIRNLIRKGISPRRRGQI